MNNLDLENLKNMPTPEARPHAKRTALAAALDAFDTGETAAGATTSNSSEEATQGNITLLRQTATSRRKRSFRMYLTSRSTQAMAASIAALVIAAPFAFQHLDRLRDAQLPTPAQTQVDEKNRTASALPATPIEPAPAKPADAPAPPQATVQNESAREIKPSEPDRRTVDKPDLGRGDMQVAGEAPTSVDAQSVRDTIAGLASPPPPPSAPKAMATASLEAEQRQRTLRPSANVAPQAPFKKKADGAVMRAPVAGQSAYHAAPISGLVDQYAAPREQSRNKFDATPANPIKQVATEPVSTFSLDVDTASYAFVRRGLLAGHLPSKAAVRTEEMINYFPYAYAGPQSAETPFKPTITVVPSPWNSNNKLVHVAIKGYDVTTVERPRANLVFLIDVSGSMGPADRLPLIKNAFRMLVDQLKPDDTIAIVTYASGSGIALEPTKLSDKGKILAAIEGLQAGGSTAGAAGISDAYRLAEAGFDKSAVNRVILATDGDFNVGTTDQGDLKTYIERKRQSGIFLSILGVGDGNHNDALMQTLAQNGNGTAAYVDTLNEARKVLVDEASSTLFTIAKDVKAQIEWNPAAVAGYRLIGYESRLLKREDFNNDAVDAGDVGSGHTMTAIYEITPVGATTSSDALRYGAANADAANGQKARPTTDPSGDPVKANGLDGELGYLKLRYKRPNESQSQLIETPIAAASSLPTLAAAPGEQRFSIAVAGFAQLLKGEATATAFSYDDVLALAQSARGDDPFGYRAEFLNLVRLAKTAQP